MITEAYITGVQDRLVQSGHLQYANEKVAQEDASMLSEGIENNLPVDQASLASEGTTPEETGVVAQALSEMADQAGTDAQVAEAKANIVRGAIATLGEKVGSDNAADPANNNVVAGHESGSVAAGESVAKRDDLNKELSNAVPNTSERKHYWNASPGKQIDKDKGHIGTERDHEGRNAQGPVVADNQELSNRVPNTRERPNYHGGPGDQKDEDKGHIGTEKKASLSDYLASL